MYKQASIGWLWHQLSGCLSHPPTLILRWESKSRNGQKQPLRPLLRHKQGILIKIVENPFFFWTTVKKQKKVDWPRWRHRATRYTLAIGPRLFFQSIIMAIREVCLVSHIKSDCRSCLTNDTMNHFLCLLMEGFSDCFIFSLKKITISLWAYAFTSTQSQITPIMLMPAGIYIYGYII